MKKLIIKFGKQAFSIYETPHNFTCIGQPNVTMVFHEHVMLIAHNDGLLYSPSLGRGTGHGIGDWLNLERHWTVLFQRLGKIPRGSVKKYDEAEKARDEHNKKARAVMAICNGCDVLGIPVPAKVKKMHATEKGKPTEWMP